MKKSLLFLIIILLGVFSILGCNAVKTINFKNKSVDEVFDKTVEFSKVKGWWISTEDKQNKIVRASFGPIGSPSGMGSFFITANGNNVDVKVTLLGDFFSIFHDPYVEEMREYIEFVNEVSVKQEKKLE